MKLLLDENLSPRLIQRLASLFPGLTLPIRIFALSVSRGWPPKVIHLEECDFPLRIIEELLRQSAVRISEFDKDSRTGVLAVRFAPELRFR